MTVELLDLWLPILVSTVVVFVASSIMWMFMPHHKASMNAIPDEGPMDRALGEMKLAPGGYYIPNCSDKERMKSPEFKERWKSGPWAYLVIPTGTPNFGKNLAVTFIEFLVIGVFVAYLSSQTLTAGAEYLDVFQVVGTGAVLAYVLGSIHHQFFQMASAKHVLACLFDGVVYALLTAGIFGAFWPAAETVLNGAPSIGAP